MKTIYLIELKCGLDYRENERSNKLQLSIMVALIEFLSDLGITSYLHVDCNIIYLKDIARKWNMWHKIYSRNSLKFY